MQNLDAKTEQKIQLATQICKALKEDRAEDALKLFDERDKILVEEIQKQFDDYKRTNDSQILQKAGIPQYTSKEIKSAEKIIKSAKEANAVGTGGISISADALPETFITRLLNEIKEESPLIKACNITITGFIATMPLDNTDDDPATFTGMGEKMSETSAAIKTISVLNYKLGKILYVPNEMLDMGPSWLLSYLKNKLKYCFSLGMESGIVAGDGSNGPIGMKMTRKKGTDENGAYYKKDAISLTAIDPVEYPAVVDELTYNSNGKARAIKGVILIVHPSTILRKIIPATVGRMNNGMFSEMAFPFPTEVIPSVAIDENEAIIGIKNKYEFFIGAGTSKEGKIVSDSSIKFAEHMTGLKIFMYGNGSFVDENDFKLLDVSQLKEYVPKFKLVEDVASVQEGSEE